VAKTRPGWPRLGAPAVRWTLWLALVVVCAAGLRDYRVGNDIRAWMPRLASPSPAFVLVGFERDAPSAPAFTSDLARSDRVAGVEPIIGDGALDGLAVFAARGASGSQLLATVRDALAAHDLPAALAGPPVFNEALDTWSQRGLPLASVLILVTGGVALWVTTGRLCAALAGLVAVTTGQIALLGLVAWHRQPMDMMLSMVPPLMMALGFSFAAHRAMRPGVGRVLLLSLATTCIGLGTFVSTDFAPIRSFALWGIVGLVICWAGVVALVPARQVPRVPQPSPATERAPGHRGRAWLAWLGCGAVLLAGGWALPRIGVEHDVLRYFPAESSITADYTALERELTGMLPSQVTITGGAADTHARLAAMIAATPGVRRVIAAGAADGASHHLVLADAGALASLGRPRRSAWAAC